MQPINLEYYVYILTNASNNVLYVGSTAHLAQRLRQHWARKGAGFTHKFKTTKLVYLESVTSLQLARKRERQLKRWRRVWKEDLVESLNPTWKDLKPKKKKIPGQGPG